MKHSKSHQLSQFAQDGDLLYSFYSNNNGSPLATAIRSIQEIYAKLPEDAHIVHTDSSPQRKIRIKSRKNTP